MRMCDKPGDSKAVNAVRIEWESLADDLLLADWQSSVADIEKA